MSRDASSVTFDPCTCRPQVVVKGFALDLVNSAVASSNIADCEENDPCDRRPCRNGGACEQISQRDYACRCPAQFTGASAGERKAGNLEEGRGV